METPRDVISKTLYWIGQQSILTTKVLASNQKLENGEGSVICGTMSPRLDRQLIHWTQAALSRASTCFLLVEAQNSSSARLTRLCRVVPASFLFFDESCMKEVWNQSQNPACQLGSLSASVLKPNAGRSKTWRWTC